MRLGAKFGLEVLSTLSLPSSRGRIDELDFRLRIDKSNERRVW